MRKCPEPIKARELGCLDLKKDAQCGRRIFKDVAYLNSEPGKLSPKTMVYCERINRSVPET